MKLTENQLRRAAQLAQHKDFSRLQETDDVIVSPRMEQNMQALMEQVQRGEFKPARASMGWRYYTKTGIAAVLICFLLTCVTMPQALIAGYQRLIQTVETVCEEYTQHVYTSDAPSDTVFIPVTFGYVPEDMVEITREEWLASLHVVLEKREEGQLLKHFVLEQDLLTEDDTMTYIYDTEDAVIETVLISGEPVEFVKKEGNILFVWFHRAYLITGQTNLSHEETLKILEQVKFNE